jgi:hypothetical protein
MDNINQNLKKSNKIINTTEFKKPDGYKNVNTWSTIYIKNNFKIIPKN